MSGDLKLEYISHLGEWDLVFENNDLKQDDGLETAVILSLFLDKRARDDDELPDPVNGSKRGWLGDLLSEEEEDEIGSRLWLLERAKSTRENLEAAKQYIEESLQWMIDDGVAVRMDVNVEMQGEPSTKQLCFEIKIFKTDGTEVALKYDDQWGGVI